MAVAGCGGAGSNEEGGGDDGGGDDGGGGTGLSAPAVPSGLEATPQDGTVQLGWDAVDGADTYNVYRNTSSGVDGSGSPLDTGIDQSSYTDGTAENGTEYFYAVSAVASEGGESAESDASEEAEAIPFAAPSGLEGTSRDSEVALSWDAAGGADTYNVYRSTSSGVDASSDPLGTGISSTEYADESAQNGTEYFYAVTAVSPSGGESDASGEAEAIPFAAPSGLEGTSRDSEVALSWDAAGGADTYNVYRSTSSTSGAEGEPLATGVAETSYADGTAENGTKYYYRVTSVNTSGAESSASSEVEKTPFSEPPGQP
ncbi:fibronectin type III domain-containing protein [Salinibacter ruber]|uniref:fibronectin type III domain-containing protein n=1 Tax=Salinibacter ruber TaxID=146919 RepID=UPI002168532E|nr:cellulose 1,4-beta-cellobiosidase [Salinibacter ruber]MCS3695339.1 fibronectin type 3 domain-containing protein [Salinibacter ruber]